ncbi:MAG TPA: COX15/CtaA family protein [Solirubrobacterales bacterium]|nr:COX15/CtaA family protein [Solirubrobacterales bacterium]
MSATETPHRLRMLIDAALAVAFALVILGAIVRVGDAGLGCGPAGSGLHGWPLCRGGLLPSAHAHTILEYSHRFLASALTVLLVAILWNVARNARGQRFMLGGAIAALALIVPQALLGALTVEHGLSAGLVAAHLALAMVLLAVLVTMALAARGALGGRGSSLLRGLAALACVALLATIAAGGLIAGTERHGTPGEDTAAGAHMACGPDFPECNGAFLPFGEGEMVDIQLAHRTAMLFAVAAISLLAFGLWREGREGLALVIAFALGAQVWLGAMNVWAGESAGLIIAHLTVASALWLAVVSALALSGLGPAGASARELGAR